MYSFQSQSPKRPEKRLFLVCLTPSVLFLILSVLPQTPAPMLSRLLSVGAATGATFIASRYLLRRYRYSVAPRGENDASLDLTVTEYFGNRIRVVCRVALSDIRSVTRQKPQKRDDNETKERVFFYVDEIKSPFFCYLTVREEESLCRVVILADDRLFNLLSQCR